MDTPLHKLLQYAGEDDAVILATGLVGLMGCVLVVAAHLTTFLLLPSFNPITETISDLAAG